MTTQVLTIWIPTYQRPAHLAALLNSILTADLLKLADVVISDNSQAPCSEEVAAYCSAGVTYRQNIANLSAGVNFLRAFEECTTPWLMIVGDDDSFIEAAVDMMAAVIAALPAAVVALKFDSSLFGFQTSCQTAGLLPYLLALSPQQYPEFFNNLLLVSNWLFRVESCRPHLAAAYLGYSSKCSHLFPPLRACALDGGLLAFSPLQPVVYGLPSDGEGWPKAPTWFEMAMTLSTFSGFIDPASRFALKRLLFHSDWRRLALKSLRVGSYYSQRGVDIGPWRIHVHLCLLSWRYCLVMLLILPLLLLPSIWWPRSLRLKVGDPGRIDRW